MIEKIKRLLEEKDDLIRYILWGVFIFLDLLYRTKRTNPNLSLFALILMGVCALYAFGLILWSFRRKKSPDILDMAGNSGLWLYLVFRLTGKTIYENWAFLFMHMLFLCLILHLSFEKTIRTIGLASASLVVFVVSLYLLGFLTDNVCEFYYGVCHSLGFGNPNTLGFFVYAIIALEWLSCPHRKLPFLLAATAVSILNFKITGCRTVSILLIVLAVMGLGVDFIQDHMQSRLQKLFILFPWIMLAVSFAAGFVLIKLDLKDSNFCARFVEAVYAMNDAGLSLFPRDFSHIGRKYYFDNFYICSLFKYGILKTVCSLSILSFVNFKIIQSKNAKMLVFTVCLYLYLCMENAACSLSWAIIAFFVIFEYQNRKCNLKGRMNYGTSK